MIDICIKLIINNDEASVFKRLFFQSKYLHHHSNHLFWVISSSNGSVLDSPELSLCIKSSVWILFLCLGKSNNSHWTFLKTPENWQEILIYTIKPPMFAWHHYDPFATSITLLWLGRFEHAKHVTMLVITK